jgi:hypothetical protein
MNVIKLLAELDANFELNGFYSINVWPQFGEITLQGNFTDNNIKIAKAMNIELSYEDGYIRGRSEDGSIKITLATSN